MKITLFELQRKYCDLVKGPARLGQEAAFVIAVGAVALLAMAAFIPMLRWFAVLVALCCVVFLLVLLVLLVTRVYGRANELLSSTSIYANLLSQDRLPAPFFMDGAAATPSLQLFLYKCLSLSRPQSILELGSGQTTRLLAEFYHANPECYVLTLESSPNWHSRLMHDITRHGVSHDYRYTPLEPVNVTVSGSQQTVQTRWYGNVPDLDSHQFNLILVDGPDTEYWYSRCGILSHLPSILATSYVIVFDDAERAGERMTINACKKKLASVGKNFLQFEIRGVKTQAVFCSPDLAYLQSI